MAKGANGTIKINTQTIKQRESFGGADGKFGVATDRFGSPTSLFKNSPLALNIQNEMYRGTPEEGRFIGSDTNLLDIPGSDNGLYRVYRKVVDPVTDGVTGFGFSGTDHPDAVNSGTAYLNYTHPNNPFIVADKLNLQALTTGEVYDSTKAYKGFPDLSVVDLNTPAAGDDESPTSDLQFEGTGTNINENARALTGDGASYGSEVSDYRRQIEDTDTYLGQYSENTNTSKDFVGRYFKLRYTT